MLEKKEKITFEESYIPNKKTAKLLEQFDKEIESGDMTNFSGPFTFDEAKTHLKNLGKN